MCGRFSFTGKNITKIAQHFNLTDISVDYVPDANIVPAARVAAILNESPQKLSLLYWGLIPRFAQDKKSAYKMINARAETITQRPAFCDSVRRKRCLILADAFYEWKKDGKKKQLYKISLRDKDFFCFAGIWDCWQGKEESIYSCSIVTTIPNELIKPIHDRMPVILPWGDEKKWLHAPLNEALKLLTPFKSSEMTALLDRPSLEPGLFNHL